MGDVEERGDIAGEEEAEHCGATAKAAAGPRSRPAKRAPPAGSGGGATGDTYNLADGTVHMGVGRGRNRGSGPQGTWEACARSTTGGAPPANPGGPWELSGGYNSGTGSGIGATGYAGGGRLPYDSRGARANPGGQRELSGGYANGVVQMCQMGNVEVNNFSSQRYVSGVGGQLAAEGVEMDRRMGALFGGNYGAGRVRGGGTGGNCTAAAVAASNEAAHYADAGIFLVKPGRRGHAGVPDELPRRVQTRYLRMDKRRRHLSVNAASGGIPAAAAGDMPDIMPVHFGHVRALFQMAPTAHVLSTSDQLGGAGAGAGYWGGGGGAGGERWIRGAPGTGVAMRGEEGGEEGKEKGGSTGGAGGERPAPDHTGDVGAARRGGGREAEARGRGSGELAGTKARAPGRGANGGRGRGGSRQRNRSGVRAVESREGHRARARVGGSGLRRRYIGGTCRSGSEVEGGETNAGER
eukprot:g10801.t1